MSTIRYMLARRERLQVLTKTPACSDSEAGAALANSRRGFALLVVLIVLLVLSLMFGAMLQSTRQSTDEASSRVARLKMVAALDGALVTIAYDLSRARPNLQLGEPTEIAMGSYTVTTTVRPELSKLDINFAPVETIRKLLEASDIPTDRAKVFSANIVAWRQDVGDGQVQEGEALARPFETVADLSHVGGADLPVCLRPDVTVFTRTPSIDTSFASDRLRKAIYGNSEQPERRASYDSVVGGAAARPDLYEITEMVRGSDRQTNLRRRTILRIVPGSRKTLWIVDQEFPSADDDDVSAACRRLAGHGR